MGIKFHCPNGHRLHVKSFLGGKRAICPKCQARVIVPLESTTSDAEPHVAGISSSDAVSAAEEMSPDLLAASAHALAFPPEESSAEALLETEAPSPIKAANGHTADPIADAPSAVWYVRPATGGQFGPASGEIMRSWIAQGRVGANSLVWRAGWDEWQSAAGVFPQLGNMLAAPGVNVAAAPAGQAVPSVAPAPLPVGQVVQHVGAGGPESPAPPAAPPLSHSIRKRRRARDVRLIASAVLAVLIIILIIVLVLVSRGQIAPAPKSTDPPPAADKSASVSDQFDAPFPARLIL